jgi:hypothetical protein
MYEQQRDTLLNQQMNMESTKFTVESIQDTVQTVQALKAASTQMKGAMKGNKELNLSFIDNLQEELADMAVRGGGRGEGAWKSLAGAGKVLLSSSSTSSRTSSSTSSRDSQHISRSSRRSCRHGSDGVVAGE